MTETHNKVTLRCNGYAHSPLVGWREVVKVEPFDVCGVSRACVSVRVNVCVQAH